MRQIKLTLVLDAFDLVSKLHDALNAETLKVGDKTFRLGPRAQKTILTHGAELQELLTDLEFEVSRQALLEFAHTVSRGTFHGLERRYSKHQAKSVILALDTVRMTMHLELTASNVAFAIPPKLRKAAQRTAAAGDRSLSSLVENLLTEAAAKAGYWPEDVESKRK